MNGKALKPNLGSAGLDHFFLPFYFAFLWLAYIGFFEEACIGLVEKKNLQKINWTTMNCKVSLNSNLHFGSYRFTVDLYCINSLLTF